MLTGEPLSVVEDRYEIHNANLHEMILDLIALARQCPTCQQRVEGMVVIRRTGEAPPLMEHTP